MMSGLPFPIENHAHRMLLAATEIKEFVATSKNEETNNGTRFYIGIGINTGPEVAGVVGTKKLAHDIWGDMVNVASRMVSMSEPGKINISENTYSYRLVTVMGEVLKSYEPRTIKFPNFRPLYNQVHNEIIAYYQQKKFY